VVGDFNMKEYIGDRMEVWNVSGTMRAILELNGKVVRVFDKILQITDTRPSANWSERGKITIITPKPISDRWMSYQLSVTYDNLMLRVKTVYNPGAYWI